MNKHDAKHRTTTITWIATAKILLIYAMSLRDSIDAMKQWLQGVSVAASPVLATIGMSVCPSVCLSVCHTLALSENDAS